jgi:hypothetical protein
MPPLLGHRYFRRFHVDPAPSPRNEPRAHTPRIAKSNARHRDI